MYFKKLSNESARMFQRFHAEVDFLDLKVDTDGTYLFPVTTVANAGKSANGAEVRQNSNQIV
jgi:hypothetical protein